MRAHGGDRVLHLGLPPQLSRANPPRAALPRLGVRGRWGRQGKAVLMRRRSAAVRSEGDSTRLPSTPEGAPALTLRRPRPRPDPALADEATADGKQSGRTPQSQHARETTRLPGRAAPASRSIGTRSRGRPAALGQRSGEKRSWLHAVKREPRNKKCGTRP